MTATTRRGSRRGARAASQPPPTQATRTAQDATSSDAPLSHHAPDALPHPPTPASACARAASKRRAPGLAPGSRGHARAAVWRAPTQGTSGACAATSRSASAMPLAAAAAAAAAAAVSAAWRPRPQPLRPRMRPMRNCSSGSRRHSKWSHSKWSSSHAGAGAPSALPHPLHPSALSLHPSAPSARPHPRHPSARSLHAHCTLTAPSLHPHCTLCRRAAVQSTRASAARSCTRCRGAPSLTLTLPLPLPLPLPLTLTRHAAAHDR